MATQTVEHIYTWTGSGTATTYTKNIDIGTVNGVSFAGANTTYLLEVTLLAHGDNTTLVSSSQVYRRTFTIYKDTSNALNITTIVKAGSFTQQADFAAFSTVSATPLAVTVSSGTTITITFTPVLYSTNQLYYRAIAKMIAYRNA
jgi:hypothetical protein